MHAAGGLGRVGVGWVPVVARGLALLALARWKKTPPTARTRLFILGPAHFRLLLCRREALAHRRQPVRLRLRWSARCGGATLHAWVVSPRSSTDFVLPTQTRLPEPRVVRERRPTARAAAAR